MAPVRHASVTKTLHVRQDVRFAVSSLSLSDFRPFDSLDHVIVGRLAPRLIFLGTNMSALRFLTSTRGS